MSEEVVNTAEGGEQQAAPEYTPTQLKAMEQGWKPKEQFEGEEDQFIDAGEFIRRGELFSKIEHQSKEMKVMRQALEAMKQHHTKVEEAAYNRALKSLQDKRKSLLLEGEVAEALALEDEIDNVKAQRTQMAQQAQLPVVPEVNPEFTQWVDRNNWYGKDKIMRAAADRIGLDLAQEGVAPSEVLKRVEKEIREAFPHKFANPKQERASAVEASSRSGNSASRSAIQMDDREREVMRKIVRSGVMTEAQYMAELKKVREQ